MDENRKQQLELEFLEVQMGKRKSVNLSSDEYEEMKNDKSMSYMFD